MKKLFSKFKRYLRICKYATRYGMTIKEYKEALNTTIDVNSFYPALMKKSVKKKLNKLYKMLDLTL